MLKNTTPIAYPNMKANIIKRNLAGKIRMHIFLFPENIIARPLGGLSFGLEECIPMKIYNFIVFASPEKHHQNKGVL